MSQTTFSGPVASTNGFEGSVDLGTSGVLVTATPTTASNAAAFSADAYITIEGQDGVTYYVPVATSAW